MMAPSLFTVPKNEELVFWVGFPSLWHNTWYKHLKRERHWLMVSEIPLLYLLVPLFVETWSKISWQEVHDGMRVSYLMMRPRGVEASVSPSGECPQWPNFPKLHFPKVPESSDNAVSTGNQHKGPLDWNNSWLVSGMGTQKDSRWGEIGLFMLTQEQRYTGKEKK